MRQPRRETETPLKRNSPLKRTLWLVVTLTTHNTHRERAEGGIKAKFVPELKYVIPKCC